MHPSSALVQPNGVPFTRHSAAEGALLACGSLTCLGHCPSAPVHGGRGVQVLLGRLTRRWQPAAGTVRPRACLRDVGSGLLRAAALDTGVALGVLRFAEQPLGVGVAAVLSGACGRVAQRGGQPALGPG